MPRTTASSGRWRCSFGTSVSATRLRRRTGSIATDDWQARRSFRLPFRLLLFLDPLDRLLQLAHIVARQFSGFGELGHHRLRPPAEQAQDVVEQPVARNVTGDERFENVGVADLPHPAHGALRLEPIDRRLNRRVGRPRLGKRLLDFAYRGLPERPQRLENLQFQSCQSWLFSAHVLSAIRIYYHVVGVVKRVSVEPLEFATMPR